jgi:hypothetical protein
MYDDVSHDDSPEYVSLSPRRSPRRRLLFRLLSAFVLIGATLTTYLLIGQPGHKAPNHSSSPLRATDAAEGSAWAAEGQRLIAFRQANPNANDFAGGIWAYQSTAQNLSAGTGTYTITVPVPASFSLSPPSGAAANQAIGPLEIETPPDFSSYCTSGFQLHPGDPSIVTTATGTSFELTLSCNLANPYPDFSVWIAD